MNETLTTRDRDADTVARRLAEDRDGFLEDAANDGVAEAQALWGQVLLDRGDASGGGGWFVKAAAQDHLMALNMVGRCYDLGWGVAVDKARAAECFRVAAARGLGWAMYNYATLLTLGEGVAEDKALALDWLKRAAASGEGLAAAKAANFIGSFAEDGWAGPRDMTRAARYYARGAAGGDFRGCLNHARMLAAAGDVAGALPWLKRAGALGHARFVAQVEAFLAASGNAAFRTRGLAAVRDGAQGGARC